MNKYRWLQYSQFKDQKAGVPNDTRGAEKEFFADLKIIVSAIKIQLWIWGFCFVELFNLLRFFDIADDPWKIPGNIYPEPGGNKKQEPEKILAGKHIGIRGFIIYKSNDNIFSRTIDPKAKNGKE